MKHTIFSIVGLLGLSLLASEAVFAQGMMGYWNSPLDNATLQDQQQEEQDGQLLLDALSNQTVTCSQLSDADFDRSANILWADPSGILHGIAMNEMIRRMRGEQGEAEMHTVMGKRLTGCETPAAFSPQEAGWRPMAGMCGGGRSSYSGF